jgi:ABC-type sugar transport system ATPase subunit
MKQICKSFPGVKALEDVDFFVESGEVHCLIGANGAGKSTLMKILSGAYTKDSGEMLFDGNPLKDGNTLATRKAGISVIYQELSLVNELTVTENILINNMPKTKFGAIDWKKAHDLAKQYIEMLDIKLDPNARAGSLSIGSRQLVELMKCLAADSKLIVMDEPSATLSKDEFNTLMRIIADLKKNGMTIIYISHRLEELFQVGDKVTILKDGKNVATEKVSDLNIDKLVEYMIGYKMTANQYKKAEVLTGEDYIFETRNFTNKKIRDVCINLREKEIVGLYGLVGSGRTELLRAIYGVDRLDRGELYISGKKVQPKNPRISIKNGIGMLPENRKMQGLVLVLPVWQNVIMVASRIFRGKLGLSYKRIYDKSRDYIKELEIKTPSEKTPTISLSGGNQQKIILAKWLLQNSKILLVDEPTQGIDVKAKAEIYKILRRAAEEGHGIVIASSELEELTSVCDRILVMFQGQIVAEFDKTEIEEAAILQYAVAGR